MISVIGLDGYDCARTAELVSKSAAASKAAVLIMIRFSPHETCCGELLRPPHLPCGRISLSYFHIIGKCKGAGFWLSWQSTGSIPFAVAVGETDGGILSRLTVVRPHCFSLQG
jgi:hypothetical protein